MRRTKTKAGTISTDTPILPNIVAEGAFWEYVESDPKYKDYTPEQLYNLQLEIAPELEEMAETLYKNNPDFKNKINGRGNSGRDYLWMMMKHWAQAKLYAKKLSEGGEVLPLQDAIIDQSRSPVQEQDLILESGGETSVQSMSPKIKRPKRESPLLKEYNALKEKYPNAILLFRVGDFYESFGQDAINASRVLNITLVKAGDNSSFNELAGFPVHRFDTYVRQLINAGYSVAVVESDSKPTKTDGGLMDKDVRLYTSLPEGDDLLTFGKGGMNMEDEQNLNITSIDDLGKAYEEVVGYNIVVDDPGISRLDLLTMMREYDAETPDKPFSKIIPELMESHVKQNKFNDGGSIENAKVESIIDRFLNKIDSAESVEAFMVALGAELDLNFHPDDTFENYTNDNSEELFSELHTDLLNTIMDQCFDYGDKTGIDIYGIANSALRKELISRGFPPEEFEKGGKVSEKAGKTENQIIAKTIIQQLGGMNRLGIMTGAYNFIAVDNGVSFRIKNRKVNYVKITLNDKDFYDMEFGLIRGDNYTIVNEISGAYNDMLIPMFEESTGMDLILKRGGEVILKEAGGTLNVDNIFLKSFTLKELHDWFSKSFPDSFEITVYSGEAQEYGDIIFSYGNYKSGTYTKDKYSLYDRLNYEVRQGDENTYIQFLIEAQKGNICLVSWGYKEYNTGLHYITTVLSLIHAAIKIPFKVFEKGGKVESKSNSDGYTIKKVKHPYFYEDGYGYAYYKDGKVIGFLFRIKYDQDKYQYVIIADSFPDNNIKRLLDRELKEDVAGGFSTSFDTIEEAHEELTGSLPSDILLNETLLFENKQSTKDQRMVNLDIQYPPLTDDYRKTFRLKANGHRDFTIFTVHSDADYRQAVKHLFPNMPKEKHAELVEIYHAATNELQNLYEETVNAAFMKRFKRLPQITDYKVSGIYSDELYNEDKDAIRLILKRQNEYKTAMALHKAATQYNRR